MIYLGRKSTIMKYFAFLFILFLTSCNNSTKEISGKTLLEKSIQKHDPKKEWNKASLALRIQEPRLGNPTRFSEVFLNNLDNSFELIRNREDKMASYKIDASGISSVLLNNEIVTDSISIDRYMLQPERVKIYQNSYQDMLGLPMSLNDDLISKIGTVSKTEFGRESAYQIELELKREVFSKNWYVYLSAKDFTLLGIDLISSENSNQGERLYFEKSVQIGTISIPRMKHWYDLNGEYLGSDVIVKKLED